MVKRIIFLMTMVSLFHWGKAQSDEQGFQYINYERYESAANEFQQLIKMKPVDAKAWYGLSQAMIYQQKTDEAYNLLQSANADVKDNPWYNVALGAVLLEKSNGQEAAGYFENALKATKEKDADILSAIAQAHIHAKSGNNAYAIELLNKAIKRNKKNAELYVQLGNAYRNLQNTTEGYKAYQTAININDKYAPAYHQLGDIFLSQKNETMYVDYFKKAISADPNYAPSIYRLYVYEFNRNPAKAMEYFNDYRVKSDPNIQAEYDMADLYYMNKNYEQSIAKAKEVIAKEKEEAQPRLYKLIGYSQAALKDTAQALASMQQYFSVAPDSVVIAKDYESTADFYTSMSDKKDSAMVYYEKATTLEKDSATLFEDYKKLADLAKDKNDFVAQAKWLGKYYEGNSDASNVNLFNWGLAHFRSENYEMADSVFGIYAAKYPEQGFGYYWQAKSRAVKDKDMEEGIAVPAYEKLLEVLQTDTTNNPNNKAWMIEAYNYLAAYQVNKEKNYEEAINYFEKVLEIQPENEDAKKYIAMLEKNVASQKKTEGNTKEETGNNAN